MADEKHLQLIRQGVDVWNEWRKKNPELRPHLSGADLSFASLSGANFSGANLCEADLSCADLRETDLRGAHLDRAHLDRAHLDRANLWRTNLSGANLIAANLSGAELCEANLGEVNLGCADLRETDLRGAHLDRASLWLTNLSGANLSTANLSGAELFGADFRGAILSQACLMGAQLIGTDLRGASLIGSSVFGVSVWDIQVDDETNQQNLVITPFGEPAITVDDIGVVQFIYLLLNNQTIRKVIDTITSKAVLILGRFSEDRKPILDAMRDELRKHDYLPIMFDFSPSPNQATLETVKTLAGMARFVIADITDARSVLMELGAIVPAFPSVAVRLLIKKSEHEYGMLDYIRAYRSVVGEAYQYESLEELIASIKENVIGPAEEKVKELRSRG